MKLQGQKITLEPFELKHLRIAWNWVKTPKVNQYLAVVPPKKWSEELKWFRKIKKDPNNKTFAIVDKETKKYIGNVTIESIERLHKKGTLGAMIGDSNFWGKGYGTDAITTLLTYAFKKLKLNKVRLTVFPTNKRAIACYKKCGFKPVGLMRKDVCKNGKFIDHFLMEILASEFKR